MCVNEEIVKLGLAKVQENWILPHNKVTDKLLHKLIKAELYADKKGKGIWKRPSFTEQMKQLPSDVSVSLSEKLSNLIKRMTKLLPWKRKKKMKTE